MERNPRYQFLNPETFPCNNCDGNCRFKFFNASLTRQSCWCKARLRCGTFFRITLTGAQHNGHLIQFLPRMALRSLSNFFAVFIAVSLRFAAALAKASDSSFFFLVCTETIRSGSTWSNSLSVGSTCFTWWKGLSN